MSDGLPGQVVWKELPNEEALKEEVVLLRQTSPVLEPWG